MIASIPYRALPLSVIAAFAAFPALAQVETETFLDTFPVVPAGQVAGLDAFRAEGDDTLWIVMEDGRTVVAGFAFDAAGEDVGAALVGGTPVNAWDSMGVPRPVDGAVDAAPDIDYVGETLAAATDALQDLGTRERNDLLIDLVRRMDEAESPETFQLALIEWQEAASGRDLVSDDDMDALRDAAAARATMAAPDAPGLQVATSVPSPPYLPEAPSELGAPDGKVSEVSANVSPEENGRALMADIETRATVLTLGDVAAPPVYMIVDPKCPYCARSIQNLSGDISGGRVQLRVILAPILSDASYDAVAGILLSENPAKALWDHEIAMASSGRSDLASVPFVDLPEDLVEAVAANKSIVIDYGLPGVPFFAWDTADGPAFLSGMAEAGRFSEAVTLDGPRS